jgi:Cu2+-exporting ATPase
MIENAPVGETRIQNHAERLGDRLVAPALLLSGGLYAATGDLNRLLSMIIVDYGTGIRVAAPTAVLAAMTHAARQGILIKSGRHMERLASLDTIVFDKTGTLTHGKPEIREVVSYDKRKFSPRNILSLAAAAEARLKHPVSEAIVSRAQREGIAIPDRYGSRFEIGMGVEARVNGYSIHIGSERFFARNSIRLNGAAPDIHAFNRQGCSTLLFAVDGVTKGLIAYADGLRRESRDVVRTLRNYGIRDLIMITGDNEAVAGAVAAQLAIDRYFSGAMPSDKAAIVQQLQRQGRAVAMVGDGINDSPALAYADVGIAMKHGADVARETADVVLMEDSLWKLIAAVEISRSAIANIRQNYGIIAGLNTLAMLLAIPSGLVGPATTTILSNGSAVLASLNAIRPILQY